MNSSTVIDTRNGLPVVTLSVDNQVDRMWGCKNCKNATQAQHPAGFCQQVSSGSVCRQERSSALLICVYPRCNGAKLLEKVFLSQQPELDVS